MCILFEDKIIDTNKKKKILNSIGNIKISYDVIDGYKLTVASIIFDYESNSYPYLYCAGIAYCSPRDKFSKKEGKKHAYDRLYNNLLNKSCIIPLNEHEKNNYLLHKIYKVYIAGDEFAPLKIRKNKKFMSYSLFLIDSIFYRIKQLEQEAIKNEIERKIRNCNKWVPWKRKGFGIWNRTFYQKNK